jgi:hypothetical protein
MTIKSKARHSCYLTVTPAQAHCCPGKKRDHQETRRRWGSHGPKGLANRVRSHKVAATCSCGSEPCSRVPWGQTSHAGHHRYTAISRLVIPGPRRPPRAAGTRSGWPLWVTFLGHSRKVTRPPAGGRNHGAIGADTIAKTPPKSQAPIPPSPHETYRRSRVGLWPVRSHVSDNNGLHKLPPKFPRTAVGLRRGDDQTLKASLHGSGG